MQSLKIRGPLPTSFRPLGHPAVRLLFEVIVLLALWVAIWALVWGGVLQPLSQATEVFGSEAASIQAEASH